MGSRWGWIPAFLLAMSWVPGGCIEAGIAGERADSLFQAAMTQVGRVPVKEGIEAFERVLKADPKCAPAYYEIAKLYMSLRTVQGRHHAEEALTKALHLDPDNVEYQLTLGDLLWAQGLWGDAERQYRKMLKDHPTSARIAYRIGYHALKDFIKYKEMKSIERSEEPIITPDSFYFFYWKYFAEEDRKKAITYLSRSIEIDPKFRDAYYHLGLLYFESNQPRGLVQISELLLKQIPNDKDALLFCGLEYQTMGDEKKAYKFYTEALNRMRPEERAVMESVDIIATKEDQREFGEAIALRGDVSASEVKMNSPERARFWRKQDPLFLTDFNERQMEHYGRVAYANLRFGQPSEGIAGWQADMGKTYIKFGRPLGQMSRRPEIPLVGTQPINVDAEQQRVPTRIWGRPDLDQSWVPVTPHSEMWVYEGFTITFRNWDGLEGWRFDTTYRERSTQPSGLYVFYHTPPRYVDPYRRQKYSIPHQIAAFQEGDSVREELAYAIPKSRLNVSAEGIVDLEDGFFLFDKNWEEVYREPRAVRLKWPASDKPKRAGEDSLRKNYLLAQRQVYVEPGSHHVVVEVRDRGTGSIGTFRELRTFSFADTALSMSDLLLASRINSRNPSPEGREDLEIVPNPLRTFRRSESVSVYFEVYNLRQDGFGRTEYEISYRVGRPERKEVDPALFAALDVPETRARVEVEAVVREDEPERGVDYRVRYVLPERHQVYRGPERVDRSEGGTETAVTARYAGDRRDDFAYLQIDVGQMPVGIYKLTVVVRDVGTGQTMERDALFRVVE